MVILYHGGRRLFPFTLFPLTPLLTTGEVAVSYFFVLSGFVLTYVYYRPEERFDFGRFFWARAARIYPVYLLAFGLTGLHYLDRISRVHPAKIWASLLMVQAWFPRYALSLNVVAWALSVEVFFYLLFPFILRWTYRQSLSRLIGVSLAFWAFSQITHAALLPVLPAFPWGRAFLLYNPIFHLNAFVLGVVGGVWYLRVARETPQRAAAVRSVLIGGLTAWVLGLVLLAPRTSGAAAWLPANFSFLNGIFAPFSLVIILALALERGRIIRILNHPWLVTLGAASYALYLIHVPVRWLYEQALTALGISMPFAAVYFSYLPAVLLLSVVVYLRFEEPIRLWLREQYRAGNARFLAALFALDTLSVYLSVKLSFALRLRFSSAAMQFYGPAIALALLTAFPARWFFAHLFGLYVRGPAWGNATGLFWRVAAAVGSGSVVLLGVLLAGEQLGLIPGFPRIFLLLDAVFTALGMWLGRIRVARSETTVHSGGFS